MNNKLEGAKDEVSDYELAVYKVERDLQDAARKIPEENLRMLAELLVRAHVNTIATYGYWQDEAYSKEEAKEELLKSEQLLRSLGFSTEEIEGITSKLNYHVEGLR